MNTYAITWTDHDGDACEVSQPGRNAGEALDCVTYAYGHLMATSPVVLSV